MMPHSDRQVRAAYHKAYYKKNRGTYLEKARKQRMQPGHSEYIEPIKRRSLLRTRYGITHQDYLNMLARQDNRCAICGTDNPNNGKGNRYFDIDHCHATGKVRGLLCRDCNVTVGVVEKKQAKIDKIHAYLALYK